jgi:hypothetical protein
MEKKVEAHSWTWYELVFLQTWDARGPWTEGLSRLFDAAQEELFDQQEALGDEG